MEDITKIAQDQINNYLENLIGRLNCDIENIQNGKDTPDNMIKSEAFLLYRLDALASLLQVTKFQLNQMFNNLKQNENEKS